MDLRNNIPWVEKYRPKKINQILDQNKIIKLLNNNLKIKNKSKINIPHMLFFGSPGTGKTTTALAICNHLFGYKNFNKRVLELNASDERGIQIVRNKIKNFAKQTINFSNDFPNFKIIILDEADALTDDSQFALRMIIEKYSNSTRFFLICNYIYKINSALISRCAIYRFNPLSEKYIFDCLKKIANKEKFQIEDINITKIINFSNGDLRKAIINLQKLNYFSNDITKIIDNTTITITNYQYNYLIEKLKSNSITNLYNLVNYFLNKSCDCELLFLELNKYILESDLNDLQKSLLFIKMSELDNLLATGVDEEIILLNLFSYFTKILNEYTS